MKNIATIFPMSIFFLSCSTSKMHLEANIDLNANNNSAIPIDIIFIYEEKILDEFKKMPASTWFLKKDQYTNDYAVNNLIQVVSYEIVPGQHFAVSDFKPDKTPLITILYANYLNTNDNRIILSDYSNIRLKMKESSFLLSQ
ncbi:hypothetical protein QEJ31_01805 [Pigmentibacter sp. JX0631]|uniref:hypothetical protein n=1 Tax=Pigmentibacter sp. JX0631 TaxID=2976982 RepID=UPI002468EAFB|nr:hypothetical protein [Pigmentibacter sp. JX0631]WGL60337.1 hypothetical protein QEJ31_01805 [Pigmentibacter sp. JX0631]